MKKQILFNIIVYLNNHGNRSEKKKINITKTTFYLIINIKIHNL